MAASSAAEQFPAVRRRLERARADSTHGESAVLQYIAWLCWGFWRQPNACLEWKHERTRTAHPPIPRATGRPLKPYVGDWDADAAAARLDAAGHGECGGAVGKFVSAEGCYSCVVPSCVDGEAGGAEYT